MDFQFDSIDPIRQIHPLTPNGITKMTKLPFNFHFFNLKIKAKFEILYKKKVMSINIILSLLTLKIDRGVHCIKLKVQ